MQAEASRSRVPGRKAGRGHRGPRKPQGHGSNAVYQRLRQRGYQVFAVNPTPTTSKATPATTTWRQSRRRRLGIDRNQARDSRSHHARVRRPGHQACLDAPRARPGKRVESSCRVWPPPRHHRDRGRLPVHVRPHRRSRSQGDALRVDPDRQRTQARVNTATTDWPAAADHLLVQRRLGVRRRSCWTRSPRSANACWICSNVAGDRPGPASCTHPAPARCRNVSPDLTLQAWVRRANGTLCRLRRPAGTDARSSV